MNGLDKNYIYKFINDNIVIIKESVGLEYITDTIEIYAENILAFPSQWIITLSGGWFSKMMQKNHLNLQYSVILFHRNIFLLHIFLVIHSNMYRNIFKRFWSRSTLIAVSKWQLFWKLHLMGSVFCYSNNLTSQNFNRICSIYLGQK